MMVIDFNIVQLIRTQARRCAAALDDDFLFRFYHAAVQDARKLQVKRSGGNGLQDIIRRLDLVAFHRILRQARQEHQHHRVIHLPQLVRRHHPVQPRHPNVHKHQLILVLIRIQKRIGIRNPCNGKAFAVLLRIRLQQGSQPLRVAFVIFHNGNSQHLLAPFRRRIIPRDLVLLYQIFCQNQGRFQQGDGRMQGFHVTRFAEEGIKKRRASILGDVRRRGVMLLIHPPAYPYLRRKEPSHSPSASHILRCPNSGQRPHQMAV